MNNGKSFPASVVKDHLFWSGIDETYETWIWHGEVESSGDASSGSDSEYESVEGAEPNVEVGGGMDEVEDEEFSPDSSDFLKFVTDGDKPLYTGSNRTKLKAIVESYNLKVRYGMSDTCYNDMLHMVSEWLPEGNVLPKTSYQAKKSLSSLGMEYTKIHACPNDCILYREHNADANSCPTCGMSRWKLNKDDKDRVGVPAKVLWYFPPIPRFKRMFQSTSSAKSLTWHSQQRPNDGKMRHPADSPTWKSVDKKWPDFGMESRNLRLALSSDGFNPFGSLSSKYSCWPVLLVSYNLPPWLCMKRKYMMLTLLISGPKQPGNNIDVYLQPLIDDLKILWNGVERVYDAYRGQYFTLKAMLMWTISDFPAYGNLSGCVSKGYNSCPICHDELDEIWMPHSGKAVFPHHRRWLPEDHPDRHNKEAFNGLIKERSAPIPLSGDEVFQRVKGIHCEFGKTTEEPKFKSGKGKVRPCWKKCSIFFELEYWTFLPIRHNLDVMHIEKNSSEALLGTLLNIAGKTKDTLKSRLDYVKHRPDLVPQVGEKRKSLPLSSCNLTKEEKKTVCRSFKRMKLARGTCSNIKSLVSADEASLNGMKSHDCHIILQHLLPIALRSSLEKPVRYAIIRFCLFFKQICCKVVDVEKLQKMQDDLVVTVCELEKFFPPSFFDVMIHLSVHLVREVEECGPVFYRWMYPFERYMKVFKGYVRNRNYPEGCIAEAYICEEVVEFLAERMLEVQTVGIPATGKYDLSDSCKAGLGAKVITASQKDLQLAHLCVLQNTPEFRPYFDEHMVVLKRQWPKYRKNEKWLLTKQNETFPSWIKKKIELDMENPSNLINERLKWIADGPSEEVPTFASYTINGVHFTTKERDDVRVVQCSGVSLVADAMQIASAKDKNPITASMNFYGVIQEIWELDYLGLRITLFKCDWVENEKGIKVDDLGYTKVNLNRIGHANDNFVLGVHVKQVCYIADPDNDPWSIVLACPAKDNWEGYDDDVDELAKLMLDEELDATLLATDAIHEAQHSSYRRDLDEEIELAS